MWFAIEFPDLRLISTTILYTHMQTLYIVCRHGMIVFLARSQYITLLGLIGKMDL